MHRAQHTAAVILSGLLAWLCWNMPARAGDVAAPFHVFTVLDQRVVAAGAPFQFEVSLYAAPASATDEQAIRAAFEAGRFAADLKGIELVRTDTSYAWRAGAEGTPVLELTRRFVLRATTPGVVHVPAYVYERGSTRVASAPRTVHVYALAQELFDARDAILPLVAHWEENGREEVRTGSAFMVAPDAVVTSFHVIVDARRVVLTLPDGRTMRIRKAWALDPARDVAVLYVDPDRMAAAGVQPLPFASALPRIGTEAHTGANPSAAFTYGWPSGRQRSTTGLLYRNTPLHRDEALWISSNAVRPGDSGGPLLDGKGRVLGVVSTGTVLHRSEDVLREEICIATDPRPALARMRVATAPRSLRRAFRDAVLADAPHVYVLRLSAHIGPRRARRALVQETVARLDTALEGTEGEAQLHFMKGTLHQMLGTADAAAEAYRAALAAYEGYFPASYTLGLHHLERREFTQAEAFFEHTLRYRPYAHVAAYGMALTYVGRLRYDEAVPYVQKVLEYDPTFAPGLFVLAYCYAALSDQAGVRHSTARLAEINPVWAARAEKMLTDDVFAPTRLHLMPRLPIRSTAPDADQVLSAR